ncbi:MAG: hypothetical protein E6Q90_05450 [Actinobacteria bacterium]|nr:MAG: hypothetical protein E6Q90_05450 [Actinomycetota bacterium]
MAKKKRKPQTRAQRGTAQQRPLSPRPQQAPKGPASEARRGLERRSAGPLLWLHRLPRWLIPVIMGVLLLLGLAVPGNWAGIFIVIVGLFLAWLLALSWPVITPGSRALRLVVTIVVLGAGVARMFGWF